MARFNIETSIFKDQGFQDLMIAVGDRQKAKGIVWELFELAQEFWFPKLKCIPLERFESRGLPACLYAPGGLAELRQDGVYVRGSKDAFAWLFEACDRGKKSAESRKKKYGTAQPRTKKSLESAQKLEQESKGSRKDTKATETDRSSLLSSPSSLLSTPTPCSSLSYDSADLVEDQTQAEKPTTRIWKSYRAAYELRYGTAPTWNAKVAGQLKNFASRVPGGDGPDIAAFFVSHNGSRYVASGHAVGQLLMDAEKLRTEWLTGRKITSQDARNAEFGDSLKNQIQRLSRGGA